MFSFATLRTSPFSFPISSTTGETMWHGTHHSAQKSTRTGVSEPRTVFWKSPSVTLPMFAMSLLLDVDGADGRAGRCAYVPRTRRSAEAFQAVREAIGGSVIAGVLEEALGVDRGLAPLPRGGDRLTVDPVGDVARGENTV